MKWRATLYKMAAYMAALLWWWQGSAQTDSSANRQILSEGKLTYTIVLAGSDNADIEALYKSALLEVWMRGNMVRIDFTSPLRIQNIFYSNVTRSGTVIKQTGSEKYITELDSTLWKKYFSAMKATAYTETGDTVIAGYVCQKTEATLPDGRKAALFYTKDIIPFVRGYDALLEPLPGLPIMYKYPFQEFTLVYTLKSIDASPISSNRFELPQGNLKKLEYKPEL